MVAKQSEDNDNYKNIRDCFITETEKMWNLLELTLELILIFLNSVSLFSGFH